MLLLWNHFRCFGMFWVLHAPYGKPLHYISRNEKMENGKSTHSFSILHFQFLIVLLVFLFSGCATWYQRTADFQAAVNMGNFEKANKLLDKDKKQATGKNRILYYLNKGYVEFMLGNPTHSNQYFETAENLIDEYHSNVGAEAAALITNPEARPYRPEDFEVIMINFYKALN